MVFALTKFTVLFRQRNLRLSDTSWALISHGNLNLKSEDFKLVSQRKVKPFVVRPVTIGKGVRDVALEIGGVEVQEYPDFD